jgi:hypothetical protein
VVRGFALVVALGACGRLDFTALGDASGPGGDGSHLADAPSDGNSSPLVQSVTYSATTQTYTMGAVAGLAPIAAGDMVLVMCGTPQGGGPCQPTSSTLATWLAIDLGSSLSAYVLCDAPAITSIDFTLPGGDYPATTILTEWRGMASSSCLDDKKISIACGPSTWSVSMTSQTLQNKELLVAIGMADSDNTAWTIAAPYEIETQHVASSGATVNVFVADVLMDLAPALPTASGTVGSWSDVCWNDVFAFEAVQ